MEKKIYRVNWSLVTEWYHADKTSTRDEIIDAVMSDFQVIATREQVSQRLFGGFPCEHPDGVHICHYAGGYTYLGSNSDYKSDDRLEIWEKLLEGNPEQMIKGSLFMEDYQERENAIRDV